MNKIIKTNKHKIFWFVCFLFAVSLVFILPELFSTHYVFPGSDKAVATPIEAKEEKYIPTHISTPDAVKGIYMTSWVASRNDLRSALVELIDTTELNTVVIDIKDYTGKLTLPIQNPELKKYGSEEIRAKDLKEFIATLHEKGIYVVARIAVFQDQYFVKYRPELAVKNLAGTAVWKDRKGISWIDPGSKEYWDYIFLVVEESYNIGFDEINFDYIRFPSDGNMKDISYPFSTNIERTVVLENFFKYMDDKLAIYPDLKTSADLFGMVTNATGDMGIGQLLETALPYFDYIMPMVYPSHYPPNFQGYKNPAAHPYEIIHFSMKSAVDRAEAFASTTGKTVAEMRPWLQDFDLGADYGPVEVRAQIIATYDVGLDSWILWSASNKYTVGALDSIE
ncbi:MAG: putative glycoside hydrolase [Patescibacteria group bacterium]